MHLRRVVDEEYAPKPIKRLRFNHPRSYVYRTASWMERFHVLPRAGGLDDQDSAWADDMELYFAAKAQVQREYLEWKKAQGNVNGSNS